MYSHNDIIEHIYFKYFITGSKVISVQRYSVIAITLPSILRYPEVGTHNLFLSPQLAGSTSAIAIPQLFKKCCSATATPQFRNRNFF
jgi:hypothetical protein